MIPIDTQQAIWEWAEKSGIWPAKRKPTHGTCCTCQDCGWLHDECICPDWESHDTYYKLLGRLDKGQKERYVTQLFLVFDVKLKNDWSLLDVLEATPEQKAEALSQVIGGKQ